MAAIYLASIRQRLFESENMNLQRIIDQVRSLKDAQRNAEKFRALNRDVKAFKFLLLPLPALLEVLCFRVRFRFLIFGICCFRFQLRIELVASEFASNLFYYCASASTKI